MLTIGLRGGPREGGAAGDDIRARVAVGTSKAAQSAEMRQQCTGGGRRSRGWAGEEDREQRERREMKRIS